MKKRTANGAAIRALREAITGLSVSAFCVRLDCTQGYLSNVELGHKHPTTEFLTRLARELGVSIEAISYVVPECATCAEEAA
jgi:transcriptional regulator with XRE-family HTH domain